jgi:hypothetical protein
MRNREGNKNVAYEATNGDGTSNKTNALTAGQTSTPIVQVNNALMSIAKGGVSLFE